MLRSVKLRIIVPPLVVIFPTDFLGRELVCLLFPSREHFQQFGGILAFVFVDFQTDFSVCFADGKTVNIFNGKQGVYKTDIAVNVGYWNRQFPAVKRHR